MTTNRWLARWPALARLGALTAILVALLGLWGCGQNDSKDGAIDPVRVSAFSPPDTPWRRSWEYFEQRVGETRPDIPLEMYVAGELGSEETMLSSLRRNRVQMGGFSLQGLASVLPEVNLLLAPYLFESLEEMRFILDNHLGEVYREMFRRQGVVLMSWSEVGFSGLYSSKPINGPADVRGMPMRASNARGTQQFLSAIGADTVPMGYPDVLPSLETGLIRGGSSAVTPYEMLALQTQAPFFTLTGHSGDSGAVLANGKWYDSLPPDVAEALRASLIPLPLIRADLDRTTMQITEKLSEQGVQFIAQSPQQIRIWKELAVPAREAIIAELPPESAVALLDAIERGRKAWQELKRN